MSCSRRTHNPADMTNHFHLKSQVESEWSRTTQWGQHIYRVLFTGVKILSSTNLFKYVCIKKLNLTKVAIIFEYERD